MWVKGSLLQFIVDNGSQKNIILAEVVKQLGLLTSTHPQPYTIGWLHQGGDLRMSQQCRLPYNVKPFTDEMLCDISPLEFCDVLLGQPYLWKRHALYESRPHVVIITLGNNLYRIPEVALPSAISLVIAKQCSKLISKTGKFVFLMIRPQGKKKTVATTFRQGPSARQLLMDKVVEEYKDIFTPPVRVPLHYQVKHSIDLTPGVPLPNGPIYWCSVLENDEIKRQIQELLQKGHTRPSSSPCGSPIVLGVHVDPAKIQIIRDCPSPTTLTKLRNFLGLVNFYRRFVLGFSHITWLLSQVTKGEAKAKLFWSKSQQKAFIELKDHLCSAPVLALPDLQQPFEVETDASDYAIGEVLTQHGHPVAYHNETLSDIVRKYPTYDREMYSIVQACRQWKHYILGKEMVIHTDRRPLQSI
eukprot:PITA_36053